MMHESGDRMWSAMKVQTIGKYKGKWLKVDLGGGGGVPCIVCVYHIYIYICSSYRFMCNYGTLYCLKCSHQLTPSGGCLSSHGPEDFSEIGAQPRNLNGPRDIRDAQEVP